MQCRLMQPSGIVPNTKPWSNGLRIVANCRALLRWDRGSVGAQGPQEGCRLTAGGPEGHVALPQLDSTQAGLCQPLREAPLQCPVSTYIGPVGTCWKAAHEHLHILVWGTPMQVSSPPQEAHEGAWPLCSTGLPCGALWQLFMLMF